MRLQFCLQPRAKSQGPPPTTTTFEHIEIRPASHTINRSCPGTAPNFVRPTAPAYSVHISWPRPMNGATQCLSKRCPTRIRSRKSFLKTIYPVYAPCKLATMRKVGSLMSLGYLATHERSWVLEMLFEILTGYFVHGTSNAVHEAW